MKQSLKEALNRMILDSTDKMTEEEKEQFYKNYERNLELLIEMRRSWKNRVI